MAKYISIAPRSDGMFHFSIWDGEGINEGIWVSCMLSFQEGEKLQFEIDTAIRRYLDGDTYDA